MKDRFIKCKQCTYAKIDIVSYGDEPCAMCISNSIVDEQTHRDFIPVVVFANGDMLICRDETYFHVLSTHDWTGKICKSVVGFTRDEMNNIYGESIMNKIVALD